MYIALVYEFSIQECIFLHIKKQQSHAQGTYTFLLKKSRKASIPLHYEKAIYNATENPPSEQNDSLFHRNPISLLQNRHRFPRRRVFSAGKQKKKREFGREKYASRTRLSVFRVSGEHRSPAAYHIVCSLKCGDKDVRENIGFRRNRRLICTRIFLFINCIFFQNIVETK